MLLAIFYCFFKNVLLKHDFGENGERDENIVFRNPIFWFCQSKMINDKGLIGFENMRFEFDIASSDNNTNYLV